MSDLESAAFNEVAANNNAASPNGAPEGMAPSGVNDTIREVMAAVKREWNRSHGTVASTGSANAYAIGYASAPAAYVNGQQFAFIASFANTGSATANINALGAKTIQKQIVSGMANLAAGDIQSGQHVVLEYDSSIDKLILLNPQYGSGLTGASSLSSHSVVLGAGVNALSQLPAVALGKVLGSQGAGADPAWIDSLVTVKKQTFITNGTYTPSTGMLFCIIFALGAGGGGGGATSGQQSQAGGGGAGQLSIVLATAAMIGASKAVAIGAGGTAGANTGGTGGTGGDTSVGTIAVGKGGSGGAGSTGVTNGTLGGLGGAGGASDIATTGAPGGWSYQASPGISGISGNGGGSIFGGGGNGLTSGGNGNNGTGFGSGGAGANGNGGAHTGGVGAAGVVYIFEFCNQ